MHIALALIAAAIVFVLFEAFFDASSRIGAFCKRLVQRAETLTIGGSRPISIPAAPKPVTAAASGENPIPARPVPWGELVKLGLILAVVLVIAGVANKFGGPSGAQVRAQDNAAIADAGVAVAHAETHQQQQTTRRVEEHADEIARLRQEVANARAQIASAPDLEASVAAAAAYVASVHSDIAARRAAAVQDYNSSVVS